MSVRYHAEGSRPYPRPSDSFAIGLCTGSLAAAAVSACRTVLDLVEAGVEAVLVAFRTGLRSVEVRDDIGVNAQDASMGWSMILGTNKEQAQQGLQRYACSIVCYQRAAVGSIC